MSAERNVAAGSGAAGHGKTTILGMDRAEWRRPPVQTALSDGNNPVGSRPPVFGTTLDTPRADEAVDVPTTPLGGYRDGTIVAGPGDRALPAELVDELARLLAEALVADLRAFPNLAADKAKVEGTVNSPWGYDRGSAGAAAKGPLSAAAVACRGP